MSKGKTSENRKKKYAAGFDRTKKNKERHILKMKLLNQNFPLRKDRSQQKTS